MFQRYIFIAFHLIPLMEFIIILIFQNLFKTSEEIIFLSKRKLLRVKRKKIVENSTKTSTNSAPANTGTTTNTSPEDDSRLSPPGDLPLQETPPWVPITFSWPSLEVESVSVHNQEEILDQRPYQVNFNVGLKQNFNRISSACDSGYSELDISSTATQENNTMNVVKEESLNNCDKSYLDEFQLYFNLDKMLDRTSHEENCFKELDLSFTDSEEGEACSCSVSPAESLALNLPTLDKSLTNRPTVISTTIAQGFSTTTTTTNLHHLNVSNKYLENLPGKQSTKPNRMIRGDSSQSLPVMSAPKESLLNNLRRLSLPKLNQVTADVLLVEQTNKSREIFI